MSFDLMTYPSLPAWCSYNIRARWCWLLLEKAHSNALKWIQILKKLAKKTFKCSKSHSNAEKAIQMFKQAIPMLKNSNECQTKPFQCWKNYWTFKKYWPGFKYSKETTDTVLKFQTANVAAENHSNVQKRFKRT